MLYDHPYSPWRPLPYGFIAAIVFGAGTIFWLVIAVTQHQSLLYIHTVLMGTVALIETYRVGVRIGVRKDRYAIEMQMRKLSQQIHEQE